MASFGPTLARIQYSVVTSGLVYAQMCFTYVVRGSMGILATGAVRSYACFKPDEH